MSRLTPAILPLDKGLNLQTAKILAPQGTVLDSLNYEQVDFQGQKRIDGYARYDGSCLPAIDDFVLIAPDLVTEGENSLAFNEDGELFGVFLAAYSPDLNAYAVLNEVQLPESYVNGKDFIEDYQEHYGLVLEYTALLRARIENLPGAIIGLHWFRDRLYAVADMLLLELDAVYPVYANDTFSSDDGEGVILDHADSETATYIIIENLSFSSDTIFIDRLAQEATVVSVSAGYKASFYESRTEQQVIDETPDPITTGYDFGWRFRHLGWSVPFNEGSTLFGGLTSLNQNRQGVGTEGPTSTSGNNGKPLVLTQKVNITNGNTQVNGWKTSTSPSSFNLEVAALDEVDQHYIYADAYLSWDGATGTVSAPGITGVGLVEYPANNTVVVDV